MKPDNHHLKLTAAIIGLLMAFIAVLPALVSHTAGEANARLEASMRNVQGYENLLTLLRDAETAQREFLITGNEVAFADYDAALKQYPEIRSRIKAMPHDRLNTIDILRLADMRIRDLAETTKLRQVNGLEAAATAVGKGVGRYAMESLRSMIEKQTRQALRQQAWLQGRVTGELDQAADVAFATSAINLILLASLLFMTFRALNDRQMVFAASDAMSEAAEFSEQTSLVSEGENPAEPAKSGGLVAKMISYRRKHLPVVASAAEVSEENHLIRA